MERNRMYLVGIGASAGGLSSLIDFVSNLSQQSDIAFVIVQHLNRKYKSNAQQILAKHTQIPISVISQGEEIIPGHIYLMPENTEVYIKDSHLFLETRKAGEVINRAIDALFLSMADEFRERSIGVILSGMGSDGTKGAIAIENAGGMVMVQDPQSSEFDGMSNNVIYRDHPDYILYPKDMGKQIVKYISQSIKI